MIYFWLVQLPMVSQIPLFWQALARHLPVLLALLDAIAVQEKHILPGLTQFCRHLYPERKTSMAVLLLNIF